MKRILLRSVCWALALGLALLLSPGTSLAQGEKPHPHIHIALYELREAKGELKAAAHDFNGHRVQALKDIDIAIEELEKALKYVADKRTFQGDPKASYYKTYANYPHIRHGIVELRLTAKELREAKHDFGGRREAALRDINAAVVQLELCLKYAKSK